jgi:hypothetical protein
MVWLRDHLKANSRIIYLSFNCICVEKGANTTVTNDISLILHKLAKSMCFINNFRSGRGGALAPESVDPPLGTPLTWANKIPDWGKRGSLIYFCSGIPIFCYFGANAKFQNPTTALSGRKAKSSERKKERQMERKKDICIMPSIMAISLVLWCTHSTRTNDYPPWSCVLLDRSPSVRNLTFVKELSVSDLP